MTLRLQALAANLRERQRECEKKKELCNDAYIRGMLHGYAGAYELAANLIDAEIMELQIAEYENFITEKYGGEVQA